MKRIASPCCEDVECESTPKKRVESQKRRRREEERREESSQAPKVLRTLVCLAQDSESVGQEMMEDKDSNGAIIRAFLPTEDVLHKKAEQLCAIIAKKEQSPANLFFYEGFGAAEGEKFVDQLSRELAEDFQEWMPDPANPFPAESLCTLIQRMMKVFKDAVGSENESLRWKVKIELNQGYACTKFHDDNVVLRLVMTLFGDGTVLADNAVVNWDEYEACDGRLPVFDDGDEDDEDDEDDEEHEDDVGGDVENEENDNGENDDEDDSPGDNNDNDSLDAVIREWNKSICPHGIETGPGDLTLMKGGVATERPCLHRAPYSAGMDSSQRFLITVDRVSADELQDAINMDLQ